MFRGYVDHGQVHATVQRRRPSKIMSAFISTATASDASASGTPEAASCRQKAPRPRSYFLRMNGPRGRGRAEVAVSARPPPPPASPVPPEQTGRARGHDGEKYDADAERTECANPDRTSPSKPTEHAAQRALRGAKGVTGPAFGGDEDSLGRNEGGGEGVAAAGGGARRRSWSRYGMLGGVAGVAKALGRVMGSAGSPDAEESPASQYECRFICLMLAVEDVVTALLELHTV